MAREEIFGNRTEGVSSGHAQPWPSSGYERICDGYAVLLEGFDHLIRFGLFDPWIICPLGNEQRLADPTGLKLRGTLAEEGSIPLPNLPGHLRLAWYDRPVRRNRLSIVRPAL